MIDYSDPDNDRHISVTEKTLKEFSSKLTNRDHRTYLETMLKAVDYKEPESPKTEAVDTVMAGITDTIGLIKTVFKRGGQLVKSGIGAFNTVRNTIFGIVPLIRSAVYIKWKHKADKVLALDQQCEFIKQNIEILQKNQSISPEEKEKIIKKQQAVCAKYAKKAEKLRAQFAEEEKEAAIAIAKEDPKMKEVGDGELVLEAAIFKKVAANKIDPNAKEAREKAKNSTGLQDLINSCDNVISFDDLKDDDDDKEKK